MKKAFAAFFSFALLLGIVATATACHRNTDGTTSQQGGGGGRHGQGGGDLVTPVGVASVQQKDVPIFLTGLGTVQAYNTVSVKSRVDGAITKVYVQEGQHVKQGELLAEVDPRPFQVQLEQAQAALERDQAQLRTAQLDLQRNQTLAKEGIVATQTLNQQEAQTGQYSGTVQGDIAAVNSAKLNLVYTRITAPIKGLIGLRQIDIGNIVHASDQNGMFVITQMQPIAVIFTLPEDQIRTVTERMRKETLSVEAWSRDDTQQISTGKLETVDNQIDPTTGTVRLKAVFNNTNDELWPNQFVNIHLKLDVQKNAIVAPASAIQRGQQGTFVYVVKQDNTVEVRTVNVQLIQGLTALIASGLQPGERVVTDGQERLVEGAKVDPRAPQPVNGQSQSSAYQTGGQDMSSGAGPGSAGGASGSNHGSGGGPRSASGSGGNHGTNAAANTGAGSAATGGSYGAQNGGSSNSTSAPGTHTGAAGAGSAGSATRPTQSNGQQSGAPR